VRTFSATVVGIGDFTFRPVTMRDGLRIEAEIQRILGGDVEDPLLRRAARAIAALGVQTVDAPPGWNVEALDPLEPRDVKKLLDVYGGLRQAEDSFRRGAPPQSAC
jgi:hypothetical protein